MSTRPLGGRLEARKEVHFRISVPGYPIRAILNVFGSQKGRRCILQDPDALAIFDRFSEDVRQGVYDITNRRDRVMMSIMDTRTKRETVSGDKCEIVDALSLALFVRENRNLPEGLLKPFTDGVVVQHRMVRLQNQGEYVLMIRDDQSGGVKLTGVSASGDGIFKKQVLFAVRTPVS